MITGIIIILILAAIGVGFLAAVFWKLARDQKADIYLDELAAEQQRSAEELVEIMDRSLTMIGSMSEKPLTTPPASESPQKVDWEPDDYKDLSDGVPVDVKTKFKKHNYKRFEKDELDELGELTPHQLKKIGG